MTQFRFYELALAALFGFATALIVAWLKNARDDHARAFDDFQSHVSDVADLGTDYWLEHGDEIDRQKLEARVVGGQTHLQHQLVLLSSRMRAHEIVPVALALASLIDALSGGAFGKPDRQIDPGRAKDCQVLGAALVATSRDAYGKSVGIRAMFLRFIRWPFAPEA